MDTGRGHFEEIPKELYEQAERKWPGLSGVFRVGERLVIKGSKFKVQSIKRKRLVLRLEKRAP